MGHRFFWVVLAILLAGCAQADDAVDEDIFIAVVGGTSFGNPSQFGVGLAEREREFTIETVAGQSPVIHQMRYKGVPFYYIEMYGNALRTPETAEYIGLIRTFAALHELGVTHVLSGATAGGIRPDLDYGDIVILSDFMEWESLRPANILRYTGIQRPGYFANFEVPFSASLSALLIDETRKRMDGYQGRLHETGVFAQHSPERFESPAEVRAMAQLGADLTSMYQATCAIYARQLGMRYASISSIGNPAVGVRPFTFAEMQSAVQRIAALAVPVVLEVIARIPEEAMEPEPASTGERFTGSYVDPDADD